MMKIQILSDLHLDFEPFVGSFDGADLLVLAGDVAEVRNPMLEDFLDTITVPYIYIPGNHEYYGDSIKNMSLEPLTRCVIEYSGVRFACCTLWSNPTIGDFSFMNDGRLIADFNIWEEHEKDMAFMNSIGQVDVIITHFLPSRRSSHPRYRGALQSYFVTEMPIGSFGEKLWIHGHTHDSFSYVENGVQVIANPKGYRSENPDFDPRLIYELDTPS